MDIQKLEFPTHLLEHNLSDQDLAIIPTDKLAIAKDWNKLRRQTEWCIEQTVEGRRLVSVLAEEQEHRHKVIDEQLEFWGRIRWLMATVCGVSLTVVTILKQMGYFK